MQSQKRECKWTMPQQQQQQQQYRPTAWKLQIINIHGTNFHLQIDSHRFFYMCAPINDFRFVRYFLFLLDSPQSKQKTINPPLFLSFHILEKIIFFSFINFRQPSLKMRRSYRLFYVVLNLCVKNVIKISANFGIILCFCALNHLPPTQSLFCNGVFAQQ